MVFREITDSDNDSKCSSIKTDTESDYGSKPPPRQERAKLETRYIPGSIAGGPTPSNFLTDHNIPESRSTRNSSIYTGIDKNVSGLSSAKCFPYRKKLVIVGDQGCGKTELLTTCAKSLYPDVVIHNTAAEDIARMEIDGELIDLILTDTSGHPNDRLRPLSYPDTHVILICFAIDDQKSLDSVQEKWISEILHFCQGVPILLVGSRTDLRHDHEKLANLVTAEEGHDVRKKIGAQKYMECSAKTSEGVKEVFEAAARAALLCKLKRKKCRGGCSIL